VQVYKLRKRTREGDTCLEVYGILHRNLQELKMYDL